MAKRFAAFAVLLVFILASLIGCSAGRPASAPQASAASSMEMDRASGSAETYPEEAPVPAPAEGGEKGDAAQDSSGVMGGAKLAVNPNQKMIYTGTLEIESLEFEKAINELNLLLSGSGGYIQSSNITGVSKLSTGRQVMRSAQFTVRVPAENLESFMNGANNIGNVLVNNIDGKDVSDSYSDTEARLASQKMMEQRLLSLLSKSDKLTDILSLEQSLADVRYQIETLTGNLRKWDSLIQYSTVNVNIQEVIQVSEYGPAEPKPKALGDRLWSSLKNSLKGVRDGFYDFVVFLAGALPYLIAWGIIIAVVVIVLLRIRKRNLKRAEWEREEAKKALPPQNESGQK